MKILMLQPRLENTLSQLRETLHDYPGIDAVVFPEGYLNENVEAARTLARQHGVILIGGYRKLQERPKDQAIIVGRSGEIVMDRVKYSDTAFVSQGGLTIGIVLCDELVLQGVRSEEAPSPDLIVHCIGVGMFSKEQFDEWTAAAQQIARTYRTCMIGVSHADGFYRDSTISIPIAYAFDREGNVIFLAENDTRPRLWDTVSNEVIAYGEL
ncbi:hypothetical protein [Paenibacillus radicis (ex Gao et al. 2016)]|uniref:CN hydrolase domain-containing protein n=1 Tax=Paenibacillus radicis (ex Gao et al. 2016) TaxID=1737354 RepID=A0A917GZ54_9BACL|nr:hypothetical protein [Paenibacillus radicis (ex Gao et al. 2016)]GGG62763.1 hypothetical protein GCM10010918_15670 [Paenibacillus radicis (ex Gao et al. 2016)]